MSDRLAVMSDGRIEQTGTPAMVYESPATPFVADFLGTANLMNGFVDHDGSLRIGEMTFATDHGTGREGEPVKVCIRPERVIVRAGPTTGRNEVSATVTRRVYAGAVVQLLLQLPGGTEIQATTTNDGTVDHHTPGSTVTCLLPAESLRVLPA